MPALIGDWAGAAVGLIWGEAPRRKNAAILQRFPRENGAQSRNRTSDTAIFSRMLYQLSYLGPGGASALPEPFL